MSEDSKQKEIRLRKELAKVKAQNASESRKITKNRDFSFFFQGQKFCFHSMF